MRGNRLLTISVKKLLGRIGETERMRRRKVLQALSAGVVGISGCTGSQSDDPETEREPTTRSGRTQTTQEPRANDNGTGNETNDPEFEFDRVVDAVDDLGMDPTGESPIDDALNGAFETGTLIEFPPGDYMVAEEAPTDPPHNPSRFVMVVLG